MFAKLKKKIAEEAATSPRTGVRIPRTISKESITSVGADSGDDFASDGSSSRDDLPAQILRRNDQIRKLEAKLSDYAEQLRILQKTKDKLEIALEKHQDSSIKKLQEQNESHQATRAKMAEGMTLALEKKDQEWMEKMETVEKEKAALSARLEEMMEQSLTLFQKRDDLDELEGFQQQELAKVKHMLLRKEELLSQREQELQQKEAEAQLVKQELTEARGKLQTLQLQHEESCRLNSELEIEREELQLLKEEADKKISELEGRCQDLQSVIQQSQGMVLTLEKSLNNLQAENENLKLQQQKAAVTGEDKDRMVMELQKKVSSLERWLQSNLSQNEHLQELLQEKSSLDSSLEETRAELLAVKTNHADTVNSLETQVSKSNCTIKELQTLLRHKDDSSRAYKERTDSQITNLEQQIVKSGEKLQRAEQQMTEKQQYMERMQGEWTAEKAFLDQQVCLLQQQNEEKVNRLEDSITSMQTDRQTLLDRLAHLDKELSAANSMLRVQTEELEQCKAELNSRQMVSTEIAKALEESRRQKEDLQTQVGELNISLQSSQQELADTTEKLTLREADIKALENELQSRQDSLLQLQEEVQRLQAQLQQTEADRDSQLMSLREELLSQTQQLDSCQARISYLEVEVETLTEQLHSPAVCEDEQNGSVTVDDLDHIHRVNRDLEQQLSDKNRTIKQLQQRLAELKRTLQKELKIKPEAEAEGKEKLPESRAEKQQERLNQEPPPLPPPPSAPSPPTSNTTVTNTSDLNDSQEINFEYLKHVVLKFMSSREAEAYQLIRAVSVLLHFTREEEDMLKQTLEYKMSWFGSKPSPKGIIRPSISGSSFQWS
ncbi:golgin subfamily A member 1 isoform X2 [Oryzias melastigma]|uniref:golgin subfamily A member 1 isoform X2 n=1 Tax=Oryzias melastigma TaxID=30732 RepID=UPI000CF83594|nr:golgin subfamily A member 1 isoform X2 [Oryzias melastigma]